MKKLDFMMIFLGIISLICIIAISYNAGRLRELYECGERIDELETIAEETFTEIEQTCIKSMTQEMVIIPDEDMMIPRIKETLCPENYTKKEVICDCAINTSEPCVAYCYECVYDD